jgi:hypothetical protein
MLNFDYISCPQKLILLKNYNLWKKNEPNVFKAGVAINLKGSKTDIGLMTIDSMVLKKYRTFCQVLYFDFLCYGLVA